MDFKNGVATFVMPHWRNENDITRKYLDETLDTIFKQTDKNWQLVIIDDLSPSQEAVAYLDEIKKKAPEKIFVIRKTTNNGPGHCRNMGIKWAYEHDSPIVLFNDADDISHVDRLKVAREIFVKDPEASVVYSTFKVIDEDSAIVPDDKLSPSIVEITDGHKKNPPQGINAWIDIGTEKGYTNLTSATVVKTELAYKYPFPPEKVSEDSNAWMRYSAGGGTFVYSGETPTLYRIPQNTAGSSSRSREGGKHGFYVQKARVDTDGFTRAVEIAITNGKIKVEQRDELLVKFYLKLGETLYREKEHDLAQDQVNLAKFTDMELTKKVIEAKGFQDWAKV
ncbi:MAG: glycosyltransferase family 2 protein [Chitinispirillaceae bacterium]|nr:glycosyltransferase family 2 protein [Chitinispirillaceae bacterium]